MSKRYYTFELRCPRCDGVTFASLDKQQLEKPLNCGDCLMEKAAITELTVVRVTVEETA